jgi:hypothetical protein
VNESGNQTGRDGAMIDGRAWNALARGDPCLTSAAWRILQPKAQALLLAVPGLIEVIGTRLAAQPGMAAYPSGLRPPGRPGPPLTFYRR